MNLQKPLIIRIYTQELSIDSVFTIRRSAFGWHLPTLEVIIVRMAHMDGLRPQLPATCTYVNASLT